MESYEQADQISTPNLSTNQVFSTPSTYVYNPLILEICTEEIYPRGSKEDMRCADISFELSKNREIYRNNEIRPPFTYAALIKLVMLISKIKSILKSKIFFFERVF